MVKHKSAQLYLARLGFLIGFFIICFTAPSIAGPLNKTYNTTNFTIFYNDTPGNRDEVYDSQNKITCNGQTIPIYICNLATYLEESRAVYLSYGFRLPRNKIRVRVLNIRYNGFTRGNNIDIDNENGESPDKVYNQLMSTAAHELFHVVQNQYSASRWLPAYFKEGTATFMQRVVQSDSIDYLRRIREALINLNQQIFAWRSGAINADYAAVLWWQYAAEHYSRVNENPPGATFIKTILEKASLLKGPRVGFLNAFLLQEVGISFRQAFTDWIAANYIKDLDDIPQTFQYIYNKTPGIEYPDGYGPVKLELPFIHVGVCTQCQTSSVVTGTLAPWGAQYHVINVHDGLQSLSIRFRKTSNNKPIDSGDFVDLQIVFIRGSSSFQNLQRYPLNGFREVNFSIDNENYSKIIFIVGSADRSAKYELSFTAAVNIDINPPALITNFQASDNEDSQSTLTWTNPSDSDLAEVIVRRKTDGFPTNHTDGDIVYRNASPTPGAAVTHTDTGLTNGTTYYYAVFSRDRTGNWNDIVDSEIPDVNADIGTPIESPPPPPALPQWPMFGYNAQHTNQSVFVGPQTNNLNWAIDLSVIDPAQPIYTGSTAIGGDGTIYQVVSAQRTFKVVAYNSDGSVKWEGPEDWFNVNSMIHDLAIGPDGTVYTPFHALDPRDGTIKWSMPVQGFLTVGPDGTVYVTDPYNALYAVNPSDGAVKWVFTGDPSNCVWGCIFNSKAAVAPDGTVYISKCDGRTVLYAINPNDGTIKGRAPAQGWSCSGSFLMPISNDKMYRTHNLNSGTLQVVNLPDLSLSTFISLWGTWASIKGIAIEPDGSLIVLGWDSNGTFVLAINITTNTEKWRFTLHDNELFWSSTAPTIGADGTIYVGACKKGNFEEGTIYAINSDGALKWSRQSGCVPTQPAIGANGTLYIEEFIRVNDYRYKRLLSFKDGSSSGLSITHSPIKPVGVSIFTNRDTGYTFLVDGLNIQNMQLQIYDLAGRITFNSGWVNNGFTWSLTNNRGQPLANGVYLYIITARRYDGTILRSEVKKLIILR